MKAFEIIILVLVIAFVISVFAYRIFKLSKGESPDCNCGNKGKGLVDWYHKTYKCNCSNNK